jgi:aldose 1-epimerase
VIRAFGRTAAGEIVEEATLSAHGLTARFLTWGAVLRDIRLEGCDWPLALGFDRFEDYEAHSQYFGALCGRCANRIAEGRFTLDGREHLLERAPDAEHHLHGGVAAAFSALVWRIEEAAADALTLTLVSPDGQGGYPGRLRVRAEWRVAAPATLSLSLTAQTDAPTVVNLTQHSYWNLDGDADVRGHRLTVPADRFTEADGGLIPTGRLAPVAGTPFDFRAGRMIGAEGAAPLDLNLVLADGARPVPRLAARLEGERGVAMALSTTSPGLQVYDAAWLAVAAPGLDGRRYGPQAGLCLEPQLWPDAINQPDFPSPVLRPGETWRQRTEWRFSRQ